jgi:hypothetical protein
VSLTASILPAAQLVITNGIFTNNTASGASSTLGGGAVYARSIGQAFVSLLNCSFISNKADGNDGRGGAIFNEIHDSWPMIVDHGLFTLNTANANANSMGGAIYSGDHMVVRASSFISNDAAPARAARSRATPRRRVRSRRHPLPARSSPTARSRATRRRSAGASTRTASSAARVR